MATLDAINSMNIGVQHMSMISIDRAREALSNGVFDIHHRYSVRNLSLQVSYPFSTILRAIFSCTAQQIFATRMS
jgi:hypothetical protein